MFVGRITKVEGVKTALLCKVCLELRESYSSSHQVSDAINLSKQVPDSAGQTEGPDTADQSTKVSESAHQSRKVCDAKEWYDLF